MDEDACHSELPRTRCADLTERRAGVVIGIFILRPLDDGQVQACFPPCLRMLGINCFGDGLIKALVNGSEMADAPYPGRERKGHRQTGRAASRISPERDLDRVVET